MAKAENCLLGAVSLFVPMFYKSPAAMQKELSTAGRSYDNRCYGIQVYANFPITIDLHGTLYNFKEIP